MANNSFHCCSEHHHHTPNEQNFRSGNGRKKLGYSRHLKKTTNKSIFIWCERMHFVKILF